jgi:molecular chaperone GrpE
MAEKDMNEQGETITQNGDQLDINSDENQGGTSHLNDPVTEDSDLERLEQELAESKDKYIRLVAEFDNFKRRNARERIELIQTAGRDVISSLLDILDDCDRAQKQLDSSDDVKVIKEGVLLVFNKLRSTLQSKGVKAMESYGTEFNPDLHEALTEIAAPTPDMQGKIVDEIMKGYYLNDKLIRHAKVIVGK